MQRSAAPLANRVFRRYSLAIVPADRAFLAAVADRQRPVGETMRPKAKIAVILLGSIMLQSCAKHEAPRPVHIDAPDLALLREIALTAIAERMPSMPHDRLKYEHTMMKLKRRGRIRRWRVNYEPADAVHLHSSPTCRSSFPLTGNRPPKTFR